MSKCFDHKTTLLDTHRDFRPAIEFSRNAPIVCEGRELKNNATWKDIMLAFETHGFRINDLGK